MMDREKEIIQEMEELKEADIPGPEKWERILELARELGRMILEKDQDQNRSQLFTATAILYSL